jgi:hypothetical protein
MEAGITSDICVWDKRMRHCNCAVHEKCRFVSAQIRILRLSIAFRKSTIFWFLFALYSNPRCSRDESLSVNCVSLSSRLCYVRLCHMQHHSSPPSLLLPPFLLDYTCGSGTPNPTPKSDA